MGIIKTLKGDDGRPYISLEDMIKEVEAAKKYEDENKIVENLNCMDTVLKILHNMEKEYYEKYLFRKKE